MIISSDHKLHVTELGRDVNTINSSGKFSATSGKDQKASRLALHRTCICSHADHTRGSSVFVLDTVYIRTGDGGWCACQRALEGIWESPTVKSKLRCWFSHRSFTLCFQPPSFAGVCSLLHCAPIGVLAQGTVVSAE